MQEWIQGVFEAPEFGLALIPAAFLLGLITAVGCGCNYAVLAAVAGFAGSRETCERRDAYIISGCFVFGTIVCLGLFGALVGYFGDIIGTRLGVGGTVLAGFASILFGASALGLLPLKSPEIRVDGGKRSGSVLGAMAFGFAVGGGSMACTLLCCGPLLSVALGLAILRGQVGWGAVILGSFAAGYPLPGAMAILGVGMGRATQALKRIEGPLRKISGWLLIAVGFWLLAMLKR